MRYRPHPSHGARFRFGGCIGGGAGSGAGASLRLKLLAALTGECTTVDMPVAVAPMPRPKKRMGRAMTAAKRPPRCCCAVPCSGRLRSMLALWASSAPGCCCCCCSPWYGSPTGGGNGSRGMPPRCAHQVTANETQLSGVEAGCWARCPAKFVAENTPALHVASSSSWSIKSFGNLKVLTALVGKRCTTVQRKFEYVAKINGVAFDKRGACNHRYQRQN